MECIFWNKHILSYLILCHSCHKQQQQQQKKSNRGHHLKLQKQSSEYWKSDMIFLSPQAVDFYNSLPESVVSAQSLNSLKKNTPG